jgi:hypothetical protein
MQGEPWEHSREHEKLLLQGIYGLIEFTSKHGFHA